MEYYVYATNDCNLMCDYCSVLINHEKDNIPLKPVYSLTDLKSFIMKTQRKYSDDIADIYFFGGEPSLEYEYLQQIIQYLGRKIDVITVNYILHTNGLLLRAIPESIMNEINLLIVSINYEKIPKYNLHNSYFSIVIDGVNSIKERIKMPAIARLTITEKTSLYSEILQVYNFFDYVYWQIENCTQFNDFKTFYDTYKYEVTLIFKYWFDYFKNGVFLNFVPFTSILKFLFAHDRNTNEFACGYSKSLIYIQTNGNCYSCSDNVINNNHYIGTIYEGITFPNYKLAEFKCQYCSYVNICMGRCGRMHVEFDEKHINEYCVLNKVMFDLFLINYDTMLETMTKYPSYKEKLNDPILDYTEFTP